MNTSTGTTKRGKHPTFCPTWENQRYFILLFVQPAKIVEIRGSAVLIQSGDGQIDIAGLDASTKVAVYSVNKSAQPLA